jgi:hypothetical protein
MANRSFSAFEPIGGRAACSLKMRRSCDASILQTWLSDKKINESYRLRDGWYELRIIAPVALLPKLRAWAVGADVDALDEL